MWLVKSIKLFDKEPRRPVVFTLSDPVKIARLREAEKEPCYFDSPDEYDSALEMVRGATS